ncbi:RHS repeat-associated core domain-containing protein [Streptomyces hirsutus]|uniref:RHS repeat-associated core domain-containing protein n=1 Tax=Streptomyces hirsutus TaxID=35620 RepID=UPI0033BFED5F
MNGRSSKRIHALRRRIALASAAIMVGSLLQAMAQPALAADHDVQAAPPVLEKSVPTTAGKVKPRTVMKGPRTPDTPPERTWPKAATTVVDLPDADAKAGAEKSARVPGLSLTLGVEGKSGTKSARGGVETRVLSRKAAQQAGVDGVLFTLRGRDSKDGRTKAQAGQIRSTLDYSSFAGAYGGGYASRLTLVELPSCALTSPSKEACRTAEPVKTVNDLEKQTLTAQSVALSADAPTVLAAVAETESASGDYKATSLSPSATWTTNLNTGDFGWSYDMPVPDVPGGLTPNVGLSYTSGAIDGRTGNTNNQASWTGDGFDLWPGYIERLYKPCADDGVKNSDGNKPGDLCWAYDNAFISFNGKAGELVPDGTDSWKLKNDDGTKIDRLTSSNRGNGDNDGEYWRVTAPDGTRYYFGYHRLPGWADGKETTDSTWTVPVYGDDSGEPCHAGTFAESWCQQAWRWNLDYVVDTRSNAVTYFYDKENNRYGRNLEAEDGTPYVRGGTLNRIQYGLKSSSLYGTKPRAKVTFTNKERCISDSRTTCSDIDADAAYWYDTPWDLNCDSAEDCDQGRLSPAFFTRKRLTQVTTQVYDGSTYQDVDSWKLAHRWGMADTDYQLLLDSVQHTGHNAESSVTLPKTTFAYTQLANRLDKTGDGYAPFIKSRLSAVADESGGQIDVNYSAPTCSWDGLPTPQSNTTRCFPQYIGGSADDDPERQWFNKYVVTSVTATDRTGGAPDQVTNYAYLDGAAWHYDDDDGLSKEKFKTWSQWRGYSHVRVQTGGQGGAAAMKSQQDTYFLRGMDGDRKDASGGTKTVAVTLGEGEGDPITDHEAAAGFAYKTVSYSGPNGKVLGKMVSRPWHHQTAKKTRNWGTVTANFTGTTRTRTWTSLDNGAGSSWRITMVDTDYDTIAGRVTQVHDRGDVGKSSDNTCARTTYATVAADKILTLPSQVETIAKACDVTPSRPADVISDVRSAYDGGSYGTAPDKGDATATAVLKKYDGTTAVYLESGSTYDSYGRVLTSTDLTADVKVTTAGVLTRTARSDGRTTTTVRTPATGFPTTVETTTPPATVGDASTAQTSTTTHELLRGLPLTQTDTNGKVTNFDYDALGRSTKVWLPDRLTGQTPTYEFTYTVVEDKPVAVGTKTIGNNGTQSTSYALYDGFLRPRQTQEPGPNNGRLLADTFYDERGLVSKEFATYHTEGAPSVVLRTPEEALSVETQNRYTYDGLGRQTEFRQIAGNGDGGKVLGVTQSIHGGDRTTVIPPVGGVATTTLSDARGQTTELRQHHTRSATASYDTTRYGFTPRGELAKVTDPADNSWTYEYDLLGRQTKSVDPDKGTSRSEYDDRGQLATTDDARPDTPVLWHGYDNLGRQTQLREGSSTGTLRAKWVYDTISNAKGHLAESIRYDAGNAYSSEVVAYDRLYRPLRTSVTIPSSEGALQGTYLSATTYNVSGTVQGIGYPKAGALPAATVTYTYEDRTLRPIEMSSSQGLSAKTNYSLTGKPWEYELSKSGSKTIKVTNTYEWGTQRLATSRVDRQDIAGVDQHNTYRYDQAGNVLSVSDASRSGTDTQCFTYDGLRRLTEAWTQSTTACATAPSGSVLSGPAPYWHSYTYDKAGNRQTETLHDTSGNTTKDTERTYDYPGAGKPQPHTLTSVTAAGPTGEARDTYTYDESGNTATRTLGGDTQKLTWDVEGHLAKVTEPVEGSSAKVTEYLYDTEGNRLIGRTPTETTLYLGGTEITLAKGSSTPKATRYYSLGGGHQAVQENDGSFSVTLADHHGTAQLAIDTGTDKLTQRRTLPFGGIRGAEPTDWPGTKGFVGGTDDTKTTGLTHLGAREYDPSTGRFISVDPVLEIDKPQTLNGYTYAAQNPLAFSDPTGLGLACGGSGGASEGCPTRSDGTPGNGRPNEAVAPATGCAAPCGKAPVKSGGAVEHPAPAEPGCGFWDAKCGWNDLMRSECGFWDVKCSWNENYRAWKDVFAPDTEDVENCSKFEAVACGLLAAGFLPVGKLKKLGKLLGEGKDAKKAAEMIDEAIDLVGQIPYGEGHLSKAVQLQRLVDKKKSGNYAAALLEDGTTLVAHSDKNYHSEEYLIQRAGGRKIVAAYSEREPCASGHNCASQLRKAGVKNVSWSFPWNGIGDSGRAKATRDIGAAIKELFKS